MAKTKNTNFKLPLIAAGYALFSLMIVAVLLSTVVPFGKLLLNPQTLHVNVAISLVALTVGSLLPVLIGYVIGNYSTNSKAKLDRRFNGVLFGLLAYWIMTLCAVLVFIPPELTGGTGNVRVILMSIVPSIVVAIVLAALAAAFVRSRQSAHSILEYAPYRFLLIGSIILLPVWSFMSAILAERVATYSFIHMVIVGSIWGISYFTLRSRTLDRSTKVAWATVSVSVALIAAFVSSQLVSGLLHYFPMRPTGGLYIFYSIYAIVVGTAWVCSLIGWAIFWSMQVKSLPRKRSSKN